MKFSEILTFSAALATASAAPMKRTDDVEITFHGAAGAQFTQVFSTNNVPAAITNPLSISKISSSTNNIECTFTGVDNSYTTVDGVAEVDVGPPQTQTTGTCHRVPSQHRRSEEVLITFTGAANAKFTQYFPTDNKYTPISNALSVSHISSSANGVDCTFTGVDDSHTAVNGAAEVDVGPPQTQSYGYCWKVASPSRRSADVKVTFIGAADAKFTQYFPTDKSFKLIDNVLSVSHIEVDNEEVSCTFDGVDGSVTTVTGPNTVDVGPPQTQKDGYCWIN